MRALLPVCALLAAPAAAQQVPLPTSLDAFLGGPGGLAQSVATPAQGSLGARASLACDDFDRALLGPNWTVLGGTPILLHGRLESRQTGQAYALYDPVSIAYDQAVISFDLADGPIERNYGAAVHGLRGLDNLYTKVQSNTPGLGMYDTIGFYRGFGTGPAGSYGGFFGITPVVGGTVTVYVDPNSNGDRMVVDIDENRDGITDYTYSSLHINANFGPGVLGDGVGVGVAHIGTGADVGIGHVDDWSLNGGCAAVPTLTVVGQCGQPGSGVEATHMTPHVLVRFAWSPATGAGVFQGGSCGPVQTALGPPVRLVAVVQADAQGIAALLSPGGIPAAACGGVMQALDIAACIPSNLVQL